MTNKGEIGRLISSTASYRDNVIDLYHPRRPAPTSVWKQMLTPPLGLSKYRSFDGFWDLSPLRGSLLSGRTALRQ